MIMKNQVKNQLDFTPLDIARMAMNMTNHPFGYFKTITKEKLTGGKKVMEQFGGEVIKFTRANAMNNIQFETAVRNKLEKYGIDDRYQHEPHLWMDRYINEEGKVTPLGYHRADSHLPLLERRLYLVLSIINVFETQYYNADLQLIDKEVIKPFLPNKDSKKQIEAGIPQDDQIYYRQYKLESIKELTINGTIHTIVADTTNVE